MDVAQAAELVRRGGIVAMPTETVYGLAANALDAAAVERIFEAKRRPRTSPLIVHVDSVEMARELASEWPESAERLAAAFWPGPLTLVVSKRAIVPDVVTAGLPTVGLRMPRHPVALELIRLAGVPVAAPSANLFSGLSPTTAAHVREALDVPVLDGGACQVGIESTVVSLAGRPTLLRPGAVSRAQVEAVAGPVALYSGHEGAAPSPGLHHRHYSPRTRLVLGPPPAEGRGARVPIGDPADPATYAAALYDTLHRLDREGLDWIAVEPPPDTPEWAAVNDRLRRASAR
jgi:L-threonylcarbamoyladenylate synthase